MILLHVGAEGYSIKVFNYCCGKKSLGSIAGDVLNLVENMSAKNNKIIAKSV